jgi:hypothetical protein
MKGPDILGSSFESSVQSQQDADANKCVRKRAPWNRIYAVQNHTHRQVGVTFAGRCTSPGTYLLKQRAHSHALGSDIRGSRQGNMCRYIDTSKRPTDVELVVLCEEMRQGRAGLKYRARQTSNRQRLDFAVGREQHLYAGCSAHMAATSTGVAKIGR